MRRLVGSLAVAVGLVLAAPSSAQAPAEEADALRTAVLAVDAACAAERDGDACVLATLQATPFITTALATIGETRDRAAFADGVRRYLRASVAEIRSAAAFAMAQLFPDAIDTPFLLQLLQEPIGGVRIAALAALRASSDPAARILAERTSMVDNRTFVPEERPFDPAALDVVLPEDAAYVAFERDELERGTLVFATDVRPADAIAAMEAAGAGERFEPRSMPAWLRTAGVPIFADGPGFADVTGLVLAGRQDRGAGQAIQIALVYRDTILQRTGIALTWWPAAGAPLVEAGPAQLVAFEAAAPEAPAAVIIRPDAAAGDTAFYLDVLLADGAGADAYLAAFPQGAYRAEVQALLDRALIVELDQYRVRPGTPIAITFRNMPGNRGDWFTIMPPDAPLRDYEEYVYTAGAVNGTATLTAPPVPGRYELRVFFNNSYVVQRRIPLMVEADAPLPGAAVAAAAEGPATPPATAPGAAGALAIVGEAADGAPIVVRFAGLPGTAGAWMTIVPAGTPDGTWADWAYTTGTDGEVTLPGQAAGAYELRAFVETPRRAIVARLPVTVTAGAIAVPATIELAGAAAAGQPIAIRFAGVPDRPGNWVTIVAEGTADTLWGAYVYAPAGTNGQVTLPAQPAGRYEIRFLAEAPRRQIVARLPVIIE